MGTASILFTINILYDSLAFKKNKKTEKLVLSTDLLQCAPFNCLTITLLENYVRPVQRRQVQQYFCVCFYLSKHKRNRFY